MNQPSNLDRHLDLLSRRVGRANTVIVHHPAEIRDFNTLTAGELTAAAANHDLRVVNRMNGRQYDFTRLART